VVAIPLTMVAATDAVELATGRPTVPAVLKRISLAIIAKKWVISRAIVRSLERATGHVQAVFMCRQQCGKHVEPQDRTYVLLTSMLRIDMFPMGILYDGSELLQDHHCPLSWARSNLR
jgi:hypothetical protein